VLVIVFWAITTKNFAFKQDSNTDVVLNNLIQVNFDPLLGFILSEYHFWSFELLLTLPFSIDVQETKEDAFQIENFYFEVAKPVLTNLTVQFEPSDAESFAVVAKNDNIDSGNFIVGKKAGFDVTLKISGQAGNSKFMYPVLVPAEIGNLSLYNGASNETDTWLERLWVFEKILSLQHEEAEKQKNDSDSNKEEILQLGKQLGFLTDLKSVTIHF